MHACAKTSWYDFIKRDEGEVSYMYLDTKGLVTIGIGNLIDPLPLALRLPFQFKASTKSPGKMASQAEIEAEWKRLKNHPKKKRLITGGHRLCAAETELELSAASRQQLFWKKTAANELQLKGYFPDFDKWPADAQIAILAMAWALGAGFPARWPRFTAACKKQDFDGAAAECNISTWRSKRNAASRALLDNAARVVKNSSLYSFDHLYYPAVLFDPVTISAR